MSDRYNSENTNRKNTHRQIQFEKYETVNTSQTMQITKYNSESPIQKIHVGNIQFGEYKSENTCREIQVGIIIEKNKIRYNLRHCNIANPPAGGGRGEHTHIDLPRSVANYTYHI